MPLGNPIRKQNESRIISVLATEGQSVFTVEGGYIINQISVFRNGVRLSNAEDFTAGDGSTVTLNNEANVDDRIEFHVFDRFTVQNAIVSAASTQTINGDIVVNGKIFGNLNISSIQTGIATFSGDVSANGNIVGDNSTNISGINSVTATSFFGSGANLTGIDATSIKDGDGTVRVQGNTSGIVVTGVSTFSSTINGNLTGNVTGNISGGTVAGSTGTFSGDVSLGDDDNLYLGASNDLRIYHAAGAASHINNTGLLNIDGTTGVRLEYNNSNRVYCTSSGVTLGGDIEIADKIVHEGDTDTAIRFPGDDTFTIETGGSERLRVDSDGLKVLDKVLHFGDTDTAIRFPSADTFTVETAGSERLRIDSSGRLLLGTTTEGEASADDLTIATAGNTGMTIRSGTSSWGSFFFSDGTSGGAEYDGAIEYKHDDNYMRFRTAQGERLRIDSSGHVLIGTTAEGDVNADDLTIATTGHTGITLRSGTSNYGQIFFSDAESGTAEYEGIIAYDHSNNSMVFHTSTSERLRVDSSGYMGLGTNSPSSFNSYARDLVIARSSGDAGLTISAQDASSEYGSLHFSGGTTVRAYIDVQNGGSGRVFLMNKQNGYMAFGTNNTERLNIASDGRLTSTRSTTTAYDAASTTNDSNVVIVNSGAAGHATLQFQTLSGGSAQTGQATIGSFNESSGSKATVLTFGTRQNSDSTVRERMRINSDGRLLIGSTAVRNVGGSSATAQLQIEGTTGNNSSIALIRNQNNTGGAFIRFSKSRGSSAGAVTTVADGDVLGSMTFSGSDGTDLENATAQIKALVNGTVAGNQVPTDITFETSATNGNSRSERFRISSTGDVTLPTTDAKFFLKDSNNYIQFINTDKTFKFNNAWGAGEFIFTVGGTERVRFNHLGQVYINTSATDTMFGIKNTGTVEFITCRDTSNTLKYYVHHSGNNYNTNGNYSQISDQSLKENIVDAKSQWNDIKNIKIRNFNFTEASGYDTHTQIGCVAQEVETVSPKLVTTPREDGIKTVSNSVLYMKAVKALQEAMTRIETLEAKVSALEGS